ncbi:hypothetical protein [Stenomitos frigidus]|uniref:Uncharacterized protein n=1 Tax=Stenomitos frigidus ULC18 TaxID=2107698 RepID=A0A2T1DUE8_9CYAN|nr:hypothetical protein [Stenomitos frigidus]PSB24115.1 hypothetical protein C7B82_28230 [Stenomitos frigidus ULC18]
MAHQVPLTIITKIKPDGMSQLKQLLGMMSKEVEANPIVPFARFSQVHFARFVILEESRDPNNKVIQASLAFSSEIDAPLEAYFNDLVDLAGEGLDEIYTHCVGYPDPGERTRQSRLAYLYAHQVEVQAFYVNTVNRTVQQVQQEAKLREQVETFADQQQAKQAWLGWDGIKVRQAIQAFVKDERSLHWALAPASSPSLSRRLGETIHFLSGLLLILVLGLAFLPFAPLYAAILRFKETRDAQQDRLRLSGKERDELAIREDHAVQNQFSAVGLIKPGLFRLATVRVLLWLVNFTARHVFNHGNLAGVPLLNLDGVDTIHFARWIIIDEGRRVLFLSNYDGSLESYMNDFINKVAWGLNAVFSNGVGYPKTRWLVLDGAKDEQAFKAFLRQRQIVTQVWYTAYPQLTAVNLENNAAIRAGLSQPLNQTETDAWLRRL